MVGRPDIQGREDILKVHAKGKPLSEDLLPPPEQAPDPGRAHADEHFHKVGTGNCKERHSGLACNRLGKQRVGL